MGEKLLDLMDETADVIHQDRGIIHAFLCGRCMKPFNWFALQRWDPKVFGNLSQF